MDWKLRSTFAVSGLCPAWWTSTPSLWPATQSRSHSLSDPEPVNYSPLYSLQELILILPHYEDCNLDTIDVVCDKKKTIGWITE